MTDDTTTASGGTPWHLWLVGILALLWNGYGCYDYLMTKMQGETYLRTAAESMGWDAAQSDAFVAYYNSMPAWMSAVWAIGVWGGLAGALLLLLRNKLATPVFMVSLLAFVLSLVNTYVLSDAPDFVMSMIWMQGLIFAACVFFVWYARMMTRNGVLR